MQKETEKVAGKKRGARILIVEDENIVALDIRNTLISQGYQVAGCVASGEDAVAEVEKKRPDLVLMDIHLRGQMTGIEAARIIRQNFHVPSLYLTSFSDRGLLEQAKESEALGFILKPFEERELEAGVEFALHRWQVENRLRRTLEETDRESARPTEPSLACPLIEIKSLGRLELSLQDRTVARLEDFSPTQRELLALLLCSPSLRISQGNVQLALWPESSPDRARSSFDSLLLRFRKKFAELIKPLPVKNYFALRQGIVCLENSRVDIVEFIRDHERGEACLKKGELGLAEQALSSALEYWQGKFMAGTCRNEFCIDFERMLEQLVSSCSGKLCDILCKEGRSEEAIEIVSRALHNDPINDALVRDLCKLLRKSKKPERTQMVLKQYEKSLRSEGFSEIEIEEIVRCL